MIPVTLEQLRQIAPLAGHRIEPFFPFLNPAMAERDINTPERQRQFLAQLAHESGQFRYVRELASGEAYEGRTDLGNLYPGDGVKFKGRGLIQITGRKNYSRLSEDLFGDQRLIDHPELLEEPENACRSAAWFWHSEDLNALADAKDILRITKRINGGTNGYDDRVAFYNEACKVIA